MYLILFAFFSHYPEDETFHFYLNFILPKHPIIPRYTATYTTLPKI